MVNSTTTYVLDTSVLLSVGVRALYAFKEAKIVIPIVVIRELESKRHDPIIGFMARETLREIEKIREEHGSDLKKGVEIAPGISLHVELNHVSQVDLPDVIRNNSADTRILAVAVNLNKEAEEAGEGHKVVLVTNDLPLRLMAQFGTSLEAKEFTLPELNQGDYTGVYSAYATPDVLNSIYKGKEVSESDLTFTDEKPPANIAHYVVSIRNEKSAGMAHVHNGQVSSWTPDDCKPFDVKPRSLEQHAGLFYLHNEEVDVVSLGGRAGTGKTMLALASGLEQTVNKVYNKVVVFRPLLAVGNQNLGYLPGTEEEKMAPWAAAVFDAMESIGVTKNIMEEITARKQLDVLPITHIRGRTFTNTFMIIDEAQNLERNVLLSILSRVGAGTKVVLCWDAAQKDNLHISRNDGITAVANRLRGHEMFAHVTFTKSERSRVAQIASEILEDMS